MIVIGARVEVGGDKYLVLVAPHPFCQFHPEPMAQLRGDFTGLEALVGMVGHVTACLAKPLLDRLHFLKSGIPVTVHAIEEGLADLPPKERYDQRLEQAKPVLDALLAWANTRTAAPKSSLGKALSYLKEQWPYLLNYLKDDRLELSNNRAERSIKPFVIDRKNFLFANTPSGAKSSAVIFSLIQTAIENGLDPYRYLTWLLSSAPEMELAQPDVVRSLLPWNAPVSCKP